MSANLAATARFPVKLEGVAAELLETVACAVCGGRETIPAWIRTPHDELAQRLALPGGRSSWVVCPGCGLVYQSPRPGPTAVNRLYADGEYHQARGGVPEHYIQYSLRRPRASLAWALDRLAVFDRPGRALDIGCGVGGALVNLRMRGWQVAGVEPDPSLCRVSGQRFGLDVKEDFFGPNTFPQAFRFDLVYTCHVFEHLPDPLATATAIANLLEDERSYLLIVVPTFRRARSLAWAVFGAPHTYIFTDISLANVLAQAGLQTVASRFDGGSGDSELWLLARKGTGAPATLAIRRENAGEIQRELLTVPLRAPLGIPLRIEVHFRTLLADPSDFVQRARRRLRSQITRVGRWMTHSRG